MIDRVVPTPVGFDFTFAAGGSVRDTERTGWCRARARVRWVVVWMEDHSVQESSQTPGTRTDSIGLWQMTQTGLPCWAAERGG